MADSETLATAPSSALEEDTNTKEELMPDAPNPSEGSDSQSESDSDSDSEDESEAKAQIEALETQLLSNPSDYDSHVQVNNFFCLFPHTNMHAFTLFCAYIFGKNHMKWICVKLCEEGICVRKAQLFSWVVASNRRIIYSWLMYGFFKFFPIHFCLVNLITQSVVSSYSLDDKFADSWCLWFLKYIKALRKQGDIEKLRQAREKMSSVFPLTPEMWREWAKDETTICSGWVLHLLVCLLLHVLNLCFNLIILSHHSDNSYL